MTEAGLRERKKQKTRDAIVDAALKLFADRGYEATTIADIAAAADIAPRTFFGYFPTKEAVVFHDKATTIDSLRERITGREHGETAVDAMRAWIVELTKDVDFTDQREVARRCVVKDTPSLREHERANMAEFEDVLAEGVASDLGLPKQSLRPRMIAAAAIAAMSTLEDFYDADKTPPAEPVEILDEALVFVRGGIDALRDLPRLDA